MALSDSKFTINIHIKIKKKKDGKIVNYCHKSTLYIPVKCTMQQSVNGNVKHKTCGEGDNNKRVTVLA